MAENSPVEQIISDKESKPKRTPIASLGDRITTTLDNETRAVPAIALGVVGGLSDAIRSAGEAERPTTRNIVFEPGLHIAGKNGLGSPFLREDADVNNRFDNGDLSVNYWQDNPELTQRLSSYAPQVLAVDGLSPAPKGGALDKKQVWLTLPGRPREISPGGLYIVAGDIGYTDIGGDLIALEGKTSTNEGDQPSEFTDAETTAAANSQREFNNELSTSKRSGIEMLIGAGILAVGGAAIRPVLEERNPRQHTDKGKSIARRTILKAGALGAAFLATKGFLRMGSSRLQAGENAADTTTEPSKDFWQKINSYANDISQDGFVDGRTALLIAKQEDAMDYLQENHKVTADAKGAIVMGDAHDYKAELFMQDKKARDEAIRSYARQIIHLADRIATEHFTFSVQQRAQLTQHLLQYLCTIDVLHVNDPGMPTGGNTQNYVREHIRPVASITSAQVENTVSRVSYENALTLTKANH